MTIPFAAFISGSDFDALLQGLLQSLKLAGLGLLFGLPLGLLFAVLSDAPLRIVRWIVLLIVEVGRGAPLLVLLYLVYYGLPQEGLTLSKLLAATVAFALSCGAYTTETFRASLRAVPDGQREAGASLGLSSLQVFRTIVLPQSIRVALPQLVSFSVLMFQGTALAFSIAVPELLSRAYQLSSETFEYLKYLSVAALMYVAVAVPVSQFARWLEHRLSRRL